MMPEVELFIGFKITEDFALKLSQIPAGMRDLYVQNDPNYLIEIQYENVRYLGKKCGELMDMDSLELAENNVYSLLGKLVPEYPYDQNPLTIFSIPCQSLS